MNKYEKKQRTVWLNSLERNAWNEYINIQPPHRKLCWHDKTQRGEIQKHTKLTLFLKTEPKNYEQQNGCMCIDYKQRVTTL